MKRFFLLSVVWLFILVSGFAQNRLLESFNETAGWSVIKSDGVEVSFETAPGLSGKCIAMHYEFTKGTGYCGLQKRINLKLPENYRFRYYLKANSPQNNLEVKFLDSSRNNVWWQIKRNYEFPADWKQIAIKKSSIEFAWGPTTDRALHQIDYMEFTISSAVGGRGTIYLDELTFEPIQEEKVVDATVKAMCTYGNGITEQIPAITDGNADSQWMNHHDSKQTTVMLSLPQYRPVGGMVIRWGDIIPDSFQVFSSNEVSGNDLLLYSGKASLEKANYVAFTETECSRLLVKIFSGTQNSAYMVREIEVKDEAFGSTANNFFLNVAKESKRGYYPRYLYGESSFWTINGVDSDEKEALVSMDGAIEAVRGGYSLEPFISVGSEFYHWANVDKQQSLLQGYLPIPEISWKAKNITLKIQAFSSGIANSNSRIYACYTLKNTGNSIQSGTLWLTVRPFQVNPHYQWLNMVGGAAKCTTMQVKNNTVVVNSSNRITPVTQPKSFGMFDYSEGNVPALLAKGFVSTATVCNGRAVSAYMEYPFTLKPGESKTVYVMMPFYPETESTIPVTAAEVKHDYENTVSYWKEKLERVNISVPEAGKRVVESIRSNLAYILINKDKDALQPGSRSYDRSWIRDGAMISVSLLQMGLREEVKRYIDWYAPYQFENGKVPCVVDRRGPDPVPENDSQGELIYLISQYFKYTHDTATVRKYYPNIKKAVEFNLSMIQQRMTDEYKHGNDSMKSMYGLLLESISHEGYSDKPRHSYWDNFFALRGFKDAAAIAGMLGIKEDAERFSAIRDEFRKNFYNSIRLTAKRTGIDYIAGCAELGDFDATSTSIVNYLCAEQEYLDSALLYNTFNRYYQYFTDRKLERINSINYTPYEVRLINTFLHLGQRDRALDLLAFFLSDQYPAGFRHWAEVVWRDSTVDKFIGDMPHSWVGGDFIASARSMFVYENEYKNSLTLAAGIPVDWIADRNGVSVTNMPVYTGSISYTMKKRQNTVHISVNGNMLEKNVLLNIANVERKLPKQVIVNGKLHSDYTETFINVREIPSTIEIRY